MLTNSSPVGRLLEELSWEGNARKYREGGRGLENVLVTEVFGALELLPRTAFLGSILAACHGAEDARAEALTEIELALVDVLPGGPDLAHGGPNIQPDAYLHLPRTTVMVEAKRMRSGSFQPEQLARECVSLVRDHRTPNRLLLLVLPSPPPIPVRGLGRLGVEDAIHRALPSVLAKADDPPQLTLMTGLLSSLWAWITWDEIGTVISEECNRIDRTLPSSVVSAVERTAHSILRALQWHA